MASGGHNRIPTPTLKAIGGYCESRHADRLDNAPTFGSPVMPEWFSDQQRSDWEQIVRDLPKGLLGRLDTGLLVEFCVVSDFMRATRAKLAEDPSDKNTRIAYSSYFDRWLRLVGELGLSPSSRARLTVPPTPEKDDPLAASRAKKARAL